ncbi:MAG: ZIP family metal transporter [Erysipelotrichaceae bacterium]|nr:ZIP family metal transporter [Erysipelotrichaceae bacterium]
MGNTILIIIIPLIGTTLGSLLAIFMKKDMCMSLYKFMLGLSAGVMLASSIWSLIIPAIEMSNNVFPTIIGIILGFLFIIVLKIIKPNNESKMLSFTVIIHNIPEGFCVGIALASALTMEPVLLTSAYALSIGIAVQNIPEGSIVSLNALHDNTKAKAILDGFLSGVVEPIASIAAIILVSVIAFILPYSLAFAAGAMLYVVINELIPNANSLSGNIGFFAGFIIMMLLDVVLG